MVQLIGTYQKTVSKLKCLGPSGIYKDNTTKFVDNRYRGNYETNVSNKNIRKRIISIPATLYIAI